MTTPYKQKKIKPTQNASIFWCSDCNLPLISHECAICNAKGKQINLGLPGDIRFCSPYERSILHDLLISRYGTDPLDNRIILLNKIGGEDKTDQVVLDGFILGIVRYDLKILDWQLDLSMDGAAILTGYTNQRTVELSDIRGHLSGKTVKSDLVVSCSDDIKMGNDVIIRKGSMVGVGTALLNSNDMAKDETPAVRIRKIGSTKSRLHEKIPSMDDVIKANKPAIKHLGKNAINTIRGMANQREFRSRPVYVSFSGGKDSLAVLDLTMSALKKPPRAYFINTGLEFPETVEYARKFCIENNIKLEELDARDAFEQNLPDFGPPAKDYRWCCKVCKLSPATQVAGGGNFLTIDGKRKFESFSRARIPPKEENPFVPGQVNIYPIKDWRAIEVWLYIYWRGLEYNPLYDQGFERIGCWLCPAALTAEYKRMEILHPKLYRTWDSYLHEWAESKGFSKEYIRHGFWRWRDHPPKMKQLAQQLGISIMPKDAEPEAFNIKIVSGISPCKAGGYSIEGNVKGIRIENAIQTLKIVGEVHYSEDLGVVISQTPEGSIKLYTDGTLQINAHDEETAGRLFNSAIRQLVRSARCTGCAICEKACPENAITIEDKSIIVTDNCNRCGKCTEVCVAVRYLDKMNLGSGSS
ncbi:MAG: phosphoadenosine phosphosulfate reductase family protein [Methanosarcinales archaeon]|nr:phosphoadenosine phosphosulfate reductase family protein [Methanosarcinales archaeon]